MEDKSKTSLIRHVQKILSLMKINNIILVLSTHLILLSSFMIDFFSVHVIREVSLLYTWERSFKLYLGDTELEIQEQRQP